MRYFEQTGKEYEAYLQELHGQEQQTELTMTAKSIPANRSAETILSSQLSDLSPLSGRNSGLLPAIPSALSGLQRRDTSSVLAGIRDPNRKKDRRSSKV